MDENNGMLSGFSQQSKIALLVASIVTLVVLGLAANWVFNKEYRSLFADLAPKDSAAVMKQLEELKIPYKINSKTGNLEVPSSEVHNTRLQLMGTDIALSGGVGYEIFDNSDFGMTEFAQRINFQRALEGELQRTIMSLLQVKHSRVHLVLPERNLFRENKELPSASVTLIIKNGMSLAQNQISGVQRLVAASVSGLKEQMVTISDQQGVTLSQEAPMSESSYAIPWRLKQKKEVEGYLTKKVSRVLEYAFSERDVVVTVDVILDFDQIKRTEETIIPMEKGLAISREKESIYGGDGKSKKSNKNVTKETEYEMGHAIAEITKNPGKIERISVGVLLTKFLSENDQAQLQKLVETTVGFDERRGDSIAIYSSIYVDPKRVPGGSIEETAVIERNETPMKSMVSEEAGTSNTFNVSGYKIEFSAVFYAFCFVVFMLFLLVIVFLRKKSNDRPRKLSEEERENVLIHLQHWLGEEKHE